MPTPEEIIDALVLTVTANRSEWFSPDDHKVAQEAARLLDNRAADILREIRQKRQAEEQRAAGTDQTVYGIALVTMPRKPRGDIGKSRGPLHRKARKKARK